MSESVLYKAHYNIWFLSKVHTLLFLICPYSYCVFIYMDIIGAMQKEEYKFYNICTQAIIT